MDNLINNIFNLWGINLPQSLRTPIISAVSLLGMACVLYLIMKIASPRASSFRTYCVKYITIVSAILIIIGFYVSSGANLIIQKEPKEPIVKFEWKDDVLVLTESSNTTITNPGVTGQAATDGIIVVNWTCTISINNGAYQAGGNYYTVKQGDTYRINNQQSATNYFISVENPAIKDIISVIIE